MEWNTKKMRHDNDPQEAIVFWRSVSCSLCLLLSSVSCSVKKHIIDTRHTLTSDLLPQVDRSPPPCCSNLPTLFSLIGCAQKGRQQASVAHLRNVIVPQTKSFWYQICVKAVQLPRSKSEALPVEEEITLNLKASETRIRYWWYTCSGECIGACLSDLLLHLRLLLLFWRPCGRGPIWI